MRRRSRAGTRVDGIGLPTASVRPTTIGFAAFRLAGIAGALMLGSAVAADEPVALDVVFVLDESESMRAHDPDRRTPRLVVDFARALASGGIDGRVGLVTFADSAQLEEPLGDVRDDAHRARLGDAVATLPTDGQSSDSPAGIERALDELAHHGRPGARKAVVFIGDGAVDLGDPDRDDQSERRLREALSDASVAAGVRVYGVAFGADADGARIESIANRTDARTHRAATPDDVIRAMDAILADLIERAPPEPPSRSTPAPLPLLPGTGTPLDAPSREPKAVADAPLPGARLLLLTLALLVLAVALVAARRSRKLRPTHPLRSWTARLGARKPLLGDAAAGVRLVDRGGVSNHRNLPLGRHQPRVEIGREAHNDLVIPQPTLSGSHASIELRADGYYLEDHRSTNGTWRNGRRLPPHRPVLLKAGDELRFAEFEFTFEGGEALPSPETQVLALPRITELGAANATRLAEDHAGVAAHAEVHDRTRAQLREDATASELGTAAQPVAAPSPEPEAAPAPPPAPSGDAALFSICIDGHLDRVAQLSPAHRSFIDACLPASMREPLAVAAEDLMRDARRDQLCKTACYNNDGVLHLVCVVPDEIERAPAWMGWSFGGFSRLLHSHVANDAFRDENTRALCLITYGRGSQAWLSLTIVAAEGGDDAIDLLSSELLSEHERAEFERTPRGFARREGLAPTSAE